MTEKSKISDSADKEEFEVIVKWKKNQNIMSL